MRKSERNRIQRILIQSLLDWGFSKKGYQPDYKDFRIYNDRITLPFYASSTLGEYFTIDPEIRMTNSPLCREILSITKKEPFNTNGMFRIGNLLNNYLGYNNINGLFEIPGKCEMYGPGYQIRIYEESDVEWLVPWYQNYMEKIGWEFIKTLSEDEKFYQFCTTAFMKLVEIKRDYGLLPVDEQLRTGNTYIGIEYYALITSVYLGLKNNYPGVQDIIEMILNYYKNGKLYSIPIQRILSHFRAHPA